MWTGVSAVGVGVGGVLRDGWGVTGAGEHRGQSAFVCLRVMHVRWSLCLAIGSINIISVVEAAIRCRS